MAGASSGVHEFDSAVRGQLIYESVRIPFVDEMCKRMVWEDNEHDKYVKQLAVAIFNRGCINISKEITRIY